MEPSGGENAAPGEEQVVFSRTAGVVASKISYMDVLDSANDWHVLESPHKDEAIPLACDFNHRGTHFAVGDEAGRIDIWSFIPVRLYVKSLELTPQVLDSLLPSPPLTESAIRDSSSAGTAQSQINHGGWSSVSIQWSRCSRYMAAAYIQKGKEVLLPGLMVFWNIVEGQVEGYLRLPCRVSHVSLSPRDPRRGTLSCADGTTYVFYFPVPSPDRQTRESTPENAAGGPSSDAVTPAAVGGSSFDGKSPRVRDSGVASEGERFGTKSTCSNDARIPVDDSGGSVVDATAEESAMMIVEEEVASEGERVWEGSRSSKESKVTADSGVAPNAEEDSMMIIEEPTVVSQEEDVSRRNTPPKDARVPADGDTAAAAVEKATMMFENTPVASEDAGGRESLAEAVVSYDGNDGGNTAYAAEGVAGNAPESRDPELDSERRVIFDVVEEIVQNVVLSWNARNKAEESGREEKGGGPRRTTSVAPTTIDSPSASPRAVAVISDGKWVSASSATGQGDGVVEAASAVVAVAAPTDAGAGIAGQATPGGRGLMDGNIGLRGEGESHGRGEGKAAAAMTDGEAPNSDPSSKEAEITEASVITAIAATAGDVSSGPGAVAGAAMLAAATGQGFIGNGEVDVSGGRGEGGEREGIPDEGTPISSVTRQDTEVTEAALSPAGSGEAEVPVTGGQDLVVDSDVGACEENGSCSRGEEKEVVGVTDERTQASSSSRKTFEVIKGGVAAAAGVPAVAPPGVSGTAGLAVAEGQDLNDGQMANSAATNQGPEVTGAAVAAAAGDIVAPAGGATDATGSTVAERKNCNVGGNIDVRGEDDSCGRGEGGVGVEMPEEAMPTSDATSQETKVTEAAIASALGGAGVTGMDISGGQGFVVSGSIGVHGESASCGRSEGHEEGTQEAITDCDRSNVSGANCQDVIAADVIGAAAADAGGQRLVLDGGSACLEGKSAVNSGAIESDSSHGRGVGMDGISKTGRGDATDELDNANSRCESMDVVDEGGESMDDIDVRIKRTPSGDYGDVVGGGNSKRSLGGAAAEELREGKPRGDDAMGVIVDGDGNAANGERHRELKGITAGIDVQGGVTSGAVGEKATLNSTEVSAGEEAEREMLATGKIVAEKQAPSRSGDAKGSVCVGGRSLDEKVSDAAGDCDDERVGARVDARGKSGEKSEERVYGPPSIFGGVDVREEVMSEASSCVADEDGGVRQTCSRKESGSGARDLDRIRGEVGAGDDSSRSINLNSISVSVNVNPNAIPRAEFRKIWDPVRQLELFAAADSESGAGSVSVPGNVQRNVPETSPAAVALAEGDGEEEMEADACCAGGDGASSSCSGSSYGGSVAVSVVGGLGNGAGSTCSSSSNKPAGKVAVQPGRAVWYQDGETVFLLNHEGNLVKIRISLDGSLSFLGKAELHGGASPATLQLTPEGDRVLLATATKGLCLVPTDDLDLSKAEMFGENFGIRGTKNRFWATAVLGDIHGRGFLGRSTSGKKRLTIIGNPARTRDEKTDLFFFDRAGGQPERLDTPRRDGVLSLACSPLRPLLVFLCPTGEVYYREQILKTDFPGPWYPSGYVLIDNNVEYLEAEDQLDTVVTTGPNGEVLSKTQAHEIVVPWQHEAVAEEEAVSGEGKGNKEEAVLDVGNGDETEIWVNSWPNELRWIPRDDQAWDSEGGPEKGSGGPRGSPRGSGQESFGGPLARLLGATPSLLKESRKKSRSGRGVAVSEKDPMARRRRMLPKMMETLASKKIKIDEEAARRRKRTEEAKLAKAKKLREKKAAAELATARKAAVEEARKVDDEREEAKRKQAAAHIAELAETAEREAAAAAQRQQQQQQQKQQQYHAAAAAAGGGGHLPPGGAQAWSSGALGSIPMHRPVTNHSHLGHHGRDAAGYYPGSISRSSSSTSSSSNHYYSQPQQQSFTAHASTVGSNSSSSGGVPHFSSGAAADAAAWVMATAEKTNRGGPTTAAVAAAAATAHHQSYNQHYFTSAAPVAQAPPAASTGAVHTAVTDSMKPPRSAGTVTDSSTDMSTGVGSRTSSTTIPTSKVSRSRGQKRPKNTIKNKSTAGRSSGTSASGSNKVSGKGTMWGAAGSTEASWGAVGSTEASWGAAETLPDGTPMSWGAPGSTEAQYAAATGLAGEFEIPGALYRGVGSTGSVNGGGRDFTCQAQQPKRSSSPLSPKGTSPSGKRGSSSSQSQSQSQQYRQQHHLVKEARASHFASVAVAPSASAAAVTSGEGSWLPLGQQQQPQPSQSQSPTALSRGAVLFASGTSQSTRPPSVQASQSPSSSSSRCSLSPGSTKITNSSHHQHQHQQRRPLPGSSPLLPPPPNFRGVSILAEALASGRPESPPVSASGLPGVLPQASRRIGGGGGMGRPYDARLGSAAGGGSGVGAGVEMLADALARQQQQQQHKQYQQYQHQQHNQQLRESGGKRSIVSPSRKDHYGHHLARAPDVSANSPGLPASLSSPSPHHHHQQQQAIQRRVEGRDVISAPGRTAGHSIGFPGLSSAGAVWEGAAPPALGRGVNVGASSLEDDSGED